MLEITKFRPEEIDEAIEAMDVLRNIMGPFLRSVNADGMGEEDVRQMVRYLTLAKHALILMGDYIEKMMGGNDGTTD